MFSAYIVDFLGRPLHSVLECFLQTYVQGIVSRRYTSVPFPLTSQEPYCPMPILASVLFMAWMFFYSLSSSIARTSSIASFSAVFARPTSCVEQISRVPSLSLWASKISSVFWTTDHEFSQSVPIYSYYLLWLKYLISEYKHHSNNCMSFRKQVTYPACLERANYTHGEPNRRITVWNSAQWERDVETAFQEYICEISLSNFSKKFDSKKLLMPSTNRVWEIQRGLADYRKK